MVIILVTARHILNIRFKSGGNLKEKPRLYDAYHGHHLRAYTFIDYRFLQEKGHQKEWQT